MPKETETTLFDGVTTREVTVSLLEETYQQLLELFRAQKWDEAEGWRTVMAHGLAALRAQALLADVPADDSDLASQLTRVSQELAKYQAMYAVMKFKAFQLRQVAQTLEMNVAGLRNAEGAFRGTVARLREENEALKAEMQHLQQQLAEANFTPTPTASQASPPHKTRLRNSLLDLGKSWSRAFRRSISWGTTRLKPLLLVVSNPVAKLQSLQSWISRL